MSISTVSGGSSYSTAYKNDSDTSTLEKQLQKLQAELKEVSASKDEAKTKAAKQQQLKQQIQILEMSIAQKTTKSTESNQAEASTRDTKVSSTAAAKGLASQGTIDIRV